MRHSHATDERRKFVNFLGMTRHDFGEAVYPLHLLITDGGHFGREHWSQLLAFSPQLSQTFGRDVGFGLHHASSAK